METRRSERRSGPGSGTAVRQEERQRRRRVGAALPGQHMGTHREFISSEIVVVVIKLKPCYIVSLFLFHCLQSAGGVSVKARSVPLNTHTLLSDVSDLSSVSTESEHGAAGKIQRGEAGSPKVNTTSWMS